MDVSVIIVNYNTRKLTIECLQSIYAHTKNLDIEVIVVDNASKDDSCAAIRREYPQVKLITSNKNEGFGRANNLGVQAAQGKYLFFLNSDTVLIKNSIYTLFEFNEKYSSKLKIGVSGAVLLDSNKVETGSFGPLPTIKLVLKSIFGLLPRFTSMTPEDRKLFNENGYLEVGYVMGADMFILKSTFEEVGGFDPAFFMYYEETDLQRRLKVTGLQNFLIENAQIVHLEGASVNKGNSNNRKRIISTKSLLYYFRKHSKRFDFLLFKSVFFASRLLTVFQSQYTWGEKKEYLLEIVKS